jgi:hypothetical protein
LSFDFQLKKGQWRENERKREKKEIETEVLLYQGSNIMVAKLATRKAKPNGQLFVPEDKVRLFLFRVFFFSVLLYFHLRKNLFRVFVPLFTFIFYSKLVKKIYNFFINLL